MITEKDLAEAIAECMGQRNPNSGTCLKLAAYLTIKDHLSPLESVTEGHSYASGRETMADTYDSGTELSDAIQGLSLTEVIGVFDELMEALMVLNRPLYEATIRKLHNL